MVCSPLFVLRSFISEKEHYPAFLERQRRNAGNRRGGLSFFPVAESLFLAGDFFLFGKEFGGSRARMGHTYFLRERICFASRHYHSRFLLSRAFGAYSGGARLSRRVTGSGICGIWLGCGGRNSFCFGD